MIRISWVKVAVWTGLGMGLCIMALLVVLWQESRWHRTTGKPYRWEMNQQLGGATSEEPKSP